MRALTPEEIDRISKQVVDQGVPVRFQHEGRTMRLSDGYLQPKGINVIHQMVYWNFTRETAMEIAELTGTKAVF